MSNKNRNRRNNKRSGVPRNVDLSYSGEIKQKVIYHGVLKTEDDGSMNIDLNPKFLCDGSSITSYLTATFAEFKPLGFSVKVIPNLDLNTELQRGTISAYHYSSGFMAPNKILNLPRKLIRGPTTVVHVFGGYQRRWYKEINMEGGLKFFAKNLIRSAALGTYEVEFTMVCR